MTENMNLEYFPTSQFATNPAASGADNGIFCEEEASSSATSISPVGDMNLSYPQNVDSATAVYYPSNSQAVSVLVGPYGYYSAPSYPSTYASQQAMPYSSHLHSEDQLYNIRHGEFITNTSSPGSSLSSASYTNYHNVFLNDTRENSLLNDPTVQNGAELDATSPVSSSTSHFKSAFNHLNLEDSATYASNELFGKKHSEERTYSSSYKHQLEKMDIKKTHHIKKSTRTKGKKRCSNCHATESPSWRRSICKSSKGDLVCNACGLYEKTAKRKRMLVTNDDGTTKVVRKRDPRGFSCCKCGAKDSTRWRQLHDKTVHCEKCVRARR